MNKIKLESKILNYNSILTSSSLIIFGETIITNSELSKVELLLEKRLPIIGMEPRIGIFVSFFCIRLR